jgi:uncharacterized protein YceK
MDLWNRATVLVYQYRRCKCRFLLPTLAVFALCGCGTIGTRIFDDPAKSGDYHGPKIYSGVRGDIEAAGNLFNPKSASDKEVHALWPLFLLDLPFSFALDTLLLPLTIYEDLSAKAEPLPPGFRLGRWVIEAELPPPPMGRMYKARNARYNVSVAAINVLSWRSSDLERARFKECVARAEKKYGRGLEFDEQGGMMYVVLDYVEGGGPALNIACE